MHNRCYYDNYAEKFDGDTAELDMSALYARFLRHVPPDGLVLDAGCGVGRDLARFQSMGYLVVGFDQSPSMVALAKQRAKCEILECSFEEFDDARLFHGIWACASLLHVPFRELPQTLSHLAKFLLPAGVMYVSFKFGSDERSKDGRHFTDMDEKRLETVTAEVSTLTLIDLWTTMDVRRQREHETLLNALLQRSA
jgi:SAM-dependent methyltransferase